MPLIKYEEHRFSRSTQAIVDRANQIIAEYAAQGFDLTLRQLYYQFVSRDILPNNQKSYKRLGSIINDARLAGLVDWDQITDRTRHLRVTAHWDSPHSIVRACSYQFRYDKWAKQTYRPEVWIEKDALAGVFAGVCSKLDIPYFSCRGYCSQSEMWAAGQRLAQYRGSGQKPIIFHFGDHDPSGLDMTRDIKDRLKMFMGGVKLERLALNMDQIEEFQPPPNPAKTTDARAEAYIAEHGNESWELDALEPAYLAQLVRTAVLAIRDDYEWSRAVDRETEARRLLTAVSEQWPTLTANL